MAYYTVPQADLDRAVLASGMADRLHSKYTSLVNQAKEYQDKVNYAEALGYYGTAAKLIKSLEDFRSNEVKPARDRWLAEADRYIQAERRLIAPY